MSTPTRELHVKELSGKLRNMKFMQRGQDTAIKEKLEEEQKRIEDEAHWTLDIPELAAYLSDKTIEGSKTVNFVEEPSILSFQELPSIGRKSFKNFNKEIEKLAAEQELGVRLEISAQKETRDSVSEQEMTNRYKAISQIPTTESPAKTEKKRKRVDVNSPRTGTPVDAGSSNQERDNEPPNFTLSRFKFLKPDSHVL